MTWRAVQCRGRGDSIPVRRAKARLCVLLLLCHYFKIHFPRAHGSPRGSQHSPGKAQLRVSPLLQITAQRAPVWMRQKPSQGWLRGITAPQPTSPSHVTEGFKYRTRSDARRRGQLPFPDIPKKKELLTFH